MTAIYDELPARDFSRWVLERAAESLALVTAEACGWSDLGTPERVARCLRRLSVRGTQSTPYAAALDLSERLAHLRAAG